MKRDKKETFPPCDYKDCKEEGTCRAPKDKTLKEYYHFCPAHAKLYNESWDYYKDMRPDEIEASIRNAVGWERPTWNFSDRGRIYDPLGLLKGVSIDSATFSSKVDEKQVKALAVLGLTFPASKEKIKSEYRKLAKQYHPDKTKGDKDKELKFKEISSAYMYLIKTMK